MSENSFVAVSSFHHVVFCNTGSNVVISDKYRKPGISFNSVPRSINCHNLF